MPQHIYWIMWLFGLASGLSLSALLVLIGRWRAADLREDLTDLTRTFGLHRAATTERLAVLEGRHAVVPDRNRPWDGANVALEAEQARRRLSDWLATEPPLAVKYATHTPAHGTPYPRLPGHHHGPLLADGCQAYRRANLTVTCVDPGCARCSAMTAPITGSDTPIYDHVTANTGPQPTHAATTTPQEVVDTIDDLIGVVDAAGRVPEQDVPWPHAQIDGLQEWEEDLLMSGVSVPRNPHWACGTVNSGPCPTGEHPVPTLDEALGKINGQER